MSQKKAESFRDIEVSLTNEDVEPVYEHLLIQSGSGKIRRPPNAFMLFARDHRKAVSQAHPSMTNKAISTILGQTWKASPPTQRAKYHDLAKKLDLYHKQLYPEYSYNPKEARIQKRTRMRLKSEKSADGQLKTKGYLMPGKFAQRESAKAAAVVSELFKTDKHSLSCTDGNQLGHSEASQTSFRIKRSPNTKETYKPPDLAPNMYPLVGAMDDPPSNQLPDDVERMRNLAENYSKLTGEGGQTSTSSGNQPPGDRATDPRRNELFHSTLPHLNMAPWRGPLHWYYDMRLAYPMEGTAYSSTIMNERTGEFPSTPDAQMAFQAQRIYGIHHPACPCVHCRPNHVIRAPPEMYQHPLKGAQRGYRPYMPQRQHPYQMRINNLRYPNNMSFEGAASHSQDQRYPYQPRGMVPNEDVPLELLRDMNPNNSEANANSGVHACGFAEGVPSYLVPNRYHDHTYHQHMLANYTAQAESFANVENYQILPPAHYHARVPQFMKSEPVESEPVTETIPEIVAETVVECVSGTIGEMEFPSDKNDEDDKVQEIEEGETEFVNVESKETLDEKTLAAIKDG